MASFSCTGIDEAIKELEKMGQDVKKRTAAAAVAGAEAAHKSMLRRVPRRTGGLAESLVVDGPYRSVADGTFCDIYPKGTDPKGERYGEIGFVLEYGRSTESKSWYMPPHPWMRPAVEEDGPEIAEAMFKALMKEK